MSSRDNCFILHWSGIDALEKKKKEKKEGGGGGEEEPRRARTGEKEEGIFSVHLFSETKVRFLGKFADSVPGKSTA